uniref:Uncharacterized protein n=1 Tax=Oryza meridionalis TaxID=40149 RepID=A0A0E0CHY2_9ORYZ
MEWEEGGFTGGQDRMEEREASTAAILATFCGGRVTGCCSAWGRVGGGWLGRERWDFRRRRQHGPADPEGGEAARGRFVGGRLPRSGGGRGGRGRQREVPAIRRRWHHDGAAIGGGGGIARQRRRPPATTRGLAGSFR